MSTIDQGRNQSNGVSPVSPSRPCDLRIDNAAVVTLDEQGTFHPAGWLAIDRGRIVGTGPEHSIKPASARVIDADRRVVIPGLVNAHTHLSQSFMRGLGDGDRLQTWLTSYIQPLQRAMTPQDTLLASQLGLIENLKCGVTTVLEHQKLTQTGDHLEAPLLAAQRIGARMCFARGWRDMGIRAEAITDIERSMEHLLRRWHMTDNNRIQVGFGPMEVARCSAASLQRLDQMARACLLKTHVHVAETEAELREHRQVTGFSPVQWLAELGLLNNNTHLVHCVHVSSQDIASIHAAGSVVVACPVSNARLRSGIAPLAKLFAAGIPVCLATDGAASNDTQDVRETVKVAKLMSNLLDAEPVSSWALLKAVTRTASAAVGWPDAGQIEIGRRADVVVLNLRVPHASATGDPAPAIVYDGGGRIAHTVLVDGEVLLENGRCTKLSETTLEEESERAVAALFVRAGVPHRTATSGPIADGVP